MPSSDPAGDHKTATGIKGLLYDKLHVQTEMPASVLMGKGKCVYGSLQ